MNKTRETTMQSIKAAIKTLNGKGIKATQLNVANETGLSVRTIKRHWGRVTVVSDNRVTAKPNDSFERFRKRALFSTMGITQCKPWEF